MNTTSQSVHGHEVINLLAAANPPLTRSTLHGEAARRWGAGARFYTCSAEGMSLDELLAFLIARGKLVDTAGALKPDLSKVCNDHDH